MDLLLRWNIAGRFVRSLAKKEAFHLLLKVFAGRRIHWAKAPFIDQHGLVAQPFLPSVFGYLFVDPPSKLARVGLAIQAIRLAAKFYTLNGAAHLGCPSVRLTWIGQGFQDGADWAGQTVVLVVDWIRPALIVAITDVARLNGESNRRDLDP
jgi:hypothetical protein